MRIPYADGRNALAVRHKPLSNRKKNLNIMKKNNMPFQTKLYLYMLLLTVCIFGAIAVALDRYSRNREERQGSLYTFALQNATLQNVEDELEWMESTVELTVRHVMDKRNMDHEDALKFIGQLVKNNTLLLGVGYISYDNADPKKAPVDYVYELPDGTVDYNTMSRQQYNYTRTEWYRSAVKEGKGQWTEPYIDKTGTHRMVASYAQPIKDESGKLRGVVVADVALADLSDELNTVQPFKNSYSFMLSRKGTVIAHPDTALIMKEDIRSLARKLDDDDYDTLGNMMLAGKKGALHCELDGTDVLVCYAPLPHVGWSVASVCPYSTIMTELGSITFTVLAIIFVGILMLAVCIHVLLSHMVRPIREMTGAAYRIAQGDFDARLPEVTTNDDFGKLHDAFAHMQQSLKTYVSDLEKATKARERINGELEVANRIQMEILPTDFVLPQGYEQIDMDAYLTPARSVGGDFYDFRLEDGKMCFCVGDVSGKGVAAAIVMSMTCTLFRSLVGRGEKPAETMRQLNRMLVRNNQTDIFVTMFVATLDPATGHMTYCNAGHNAPYLFSPDGECAKLPVKPKLPLGLFAEVDYIEQEYTLSEKQRLLLYTDGLTEAENGSKEQMGERRVEETLRQLAPLTSHQIVEGIRERMRAFVGEAEQSDDLTLLVLGYRSCHTLIMDNRLPEIEKLPPFIDALGQEAGLERPQLMQMRLALEEALVNVVNYAYPKQETGKINLKALYEPRYKTIRLELTDSGKPFDPTRVPDADTSLGVDERPVGGLGIFLMRKCMDEVDYRRENGMNKLMMTKRTGEHLPTEKTINNNK